MRNALALVVSAVLSLGASCAAGSAAAGRYVNDQNPSDVIELRSDGTFALQEDGGHIAGTYSVDGSAVSLVTASGQKLQGRIEDGVFTDTMMGKQWKRQP